MTPAIRTQLARWAAPPMFFLSLALLIAVAAGVTPVVNSRFMHLIAEKQEKARRHGLELAKAEVQQAIDEHDAMFERSLQILLAIPILWAVFVGELALIYLLRDPRKPFWKEHAHWIWICLCPPLRLGAKIPARDHQVWFPVWGWVETDDQLRGKLERFFGIPMIIIALMILPILAFDLLWIDEIYANRALKFLFNFGTGLIWFAFAFEFIVLCSVADKKLKYCTKHWLDLTIILLPFISFLRGLRVMRAMRLARLAKLQQLSKMGRLYRLRGLAMRAFRAILMLELLNRVLRITPKKQLLRLEKQLEEKQLEVKEIEDSIAEVKRRIEEDQQEDSSSSRKEPREPHDKAGDLSRNAPVHS